MTISSKEKQRRLEQSRKDNPDKYRKKCLKKGCCKNCSKNIEARQKVHSPTVFGSYFGGFADSFGTDRTSRVCAATGQNIVNEYSRCGMYEPAETPAETKEKVRDAVFGKR